MLCLYDFPYSSVAGYIVFGSRAQGEPVCVPSETMESWIVKLSAEASLCSIQDTSSTHMKSWKTSGALPQSPSGGSSRG